MVKFNEKIDAGRLLLFVKSVNETALIQLARKSQIGEVLWLCRLAFGFSGQNGFQSFE